MQYFIKLIQQICRIWTFSWEKEIKPRKIVKFFLPNFFLDFCLELQKNFYPSTTSIFWKVSWQNNFWFGSIFETYWMGIKILGFNEWLCHFLFLKGLPTLSWVLEKDWEIQFFSTKNYFAIFLKKIRDEEKLAKLFAIEIWIKFDCILTSKAFFCSSKL